MGPNEPAMPTMTDEQFRELMNLMGRLRPAGSPAPPAHLPPPVPVGWPAYPPWPAYPTPLEAAWTREKLRSLRLARRLGALYVTYRVVRWLVLLPFRIAFLPFRLITRG